MYNTRTISALVKEFQEKKFFCMNDYLCSFVDDNFKALNSVYNQERAYLISPCNTKVFPKHPRESSPITIPLWAEKIIDVSLIDSEIFREALTIGKKLMLELNEHNKCVIQHINNGSYKLREIILEKFQKLDITYHQFDSLSFHFDKIVLHKSIIHQIAYSINEAKIFIEGMSWMNNYDAQIFISTFMLTFGIPFPSAFKFMAYYYPRQVFKPDHGISFNESNVFLSILMWKYANIVLSVYETNNIATEQEITNFLNAFEDPVSQVVYRGKFGDNKKLSKEWLDIYFQAKSMSANKNNSENWLNLYSNIDLSHLAKVYSCITPFSDYLKNNQKKILVNKNFNKETVGRFDEYIQCIEVY